MSYFTDIFRVLYHNFRSTSGTGYSELCVWLPPDQVLDDGGRLLCGSCTGLYLCQVYGHSG